MHLLPTFREEFSQKEYWNTLIKNRGTTTLKRYGEYPELCGILEKYIKPNDEMLMIGCGNSTLSADMYDVGYNKITNIDISQVVIRQMQDSHGRDRPGMVYEKMDELNTTYKDGQFSVVLDKRMLDTLMLDDSKEVRDRIEQLFQEIDRVLRVGGRYVCVSLLQEHILVQLLEYFSTAGWMLRVIRCLEAEQKAVEESIDKFTVPVFVVVCTKVKKMPNTRPVLEVCPDGDSVQQFNTETKLLDCVKSMQQLAMVCNKLGQGSVQNLGKVAIDLQRLGEENLRYSIFVLDRKEVKKNANDEAKKYAAFIVPQGRDHEWIFKTHEGHSVLHNTTGFDRLAIVTLHRDETYESLFSIQKELSSYVQNLAPIDLRSGVKVPFLTIQPPKVERTHVVHRGNSPMTGNYFIEDLKDDAGLMLRRLVFLSSDEFIQSQSTLQTVKSCNDKPKTMVDFGNLRCTFHRYMILSAALAASTSNYSRVAVIGLGGGNLCSFLQHCFNKIKVTAVDIDPLMLEIATKYFDLVQDHRLEVQILDGLEFLQQEYEKGSTYDAILFDIDGKDKTVGLYGPPAMFLHPSVLQQLKQLLHPKGVFCINLVTQSVETRKDVLKSLSLVFPTVYSFKPANQINEVVFSSERSITKDDFLKSGAYINSLAKEKMNADDVIDLPLFKSLLTKEY